MRKNMNNEVIEHQIICIKIFLSVKQANIHYNKSDNNKGIDKPMNFWLRNIILGLFLAVLAWGFLANQDLLLSLNSSFGEDEKVVVATKERML